MQSENNNSYKRFTRCRYCKKKIVAKCANSATLDTVAYSIDQQRLLREKMKKEEEQKKSKNKYPGKCKGKSETSTNKEDAKRLKKLEKDKRQIDLISLAIRQKGEEKIKEEKEESGGIDEDYEEEKEEEEEEEEGEDEAELGELQKEVKMKMEKTKKMPKIRGK